jgi:hypothetical protein
VEPGYLSGVALGCRLDGRVLESRQGLGIFVFTTAFRPVLGPTDPPIQCVLLAPAVSSFLTSSPYQMLAKSKNC